jgi:hypothetical protein
MQKIAIGLSALLLIIAATSKPGTAQEASAAVIPQGCVMYELAEYPGCVNYGTLSEDEARTARGHPQFVEPVQAATASQVPSTTPPAHAARIVPGSRE